MSLNSPAARLGGWRFRKYPTRKELLDEIEDLIKIKERLQEQNENMRFRLDLIQDFANPSQEMAFRLKED